MIEAFNLNNKNALITGGAGLMGQEHAYALLESGARVIITDLRIKQLEKARNSLSKIFDKNLIDIHVMDVSNKEEIISVLDSYSKRKINIDILINNAAIDPKVNNKNTSEELSRLENYSLEDWNHQINVGLTGAFLCSQIFGSNMAKNKGGVILNIASDLSVISPDQRLYMKKGISEEKQQVKPVTYSVIKSGLVGLTKYLATYWTDKGIRCNSLSPGGIYHDQDKDFVSKIEKLIPLGRMASKDEYRATIQYLCSDASKYMNGQNIVVDGGRSVW